MVNFPRVPARGHNRRLIIVMKAVKWGRGRHLVILKNPRKNLKLLPFIRVGISRFQSSFTVCRGRERKLEIGRTLLTFITLS